MDEPTSGLDPRSITPVMLLLKRLNREKGIAMVMATHDVELVPLFCDRIIVMHRGRVAAMGTPPDVLGNPELTRQVDLRLPKVAHLAEILRKEDGLDLNIPLTIGEARRELLKLCGTGQECVTDGRRSRESRYDGQTG